MQPQAVDEQDGRAGPGVDGPAPSPAVLTTGALPAHGPPASRRDDAGRLVSGVSARDTIAGLDWPALAEDLDTTGCALTPPIIDAAACRDTWPASTSGRSGSGSTVDMARHRYGSGQYRYFAIPLPRAVADAAGRVLAAPAADRPGLGGTAGSGAPGPTAWTTGSPPATPPGRTAPTPLLLRYGPGDWNALHRDLYGDLVFPSRSSSASTRRHGLHRRGVPAGRAAPVGPVRGTAVTVRAGPGAGVHHPRPARPLGPGLVGGRRAPRGQHRALRPAADARPGVPRRRLTAGCPRAAAAEVRLVLVVGLVARRQQVAGGARAVARPAARSTTAARPARRSAPGRAAAGRPASAAARSGRLAGAIGVGLGQRRHRPPQVDGLGCSPALPAAAPRGCAGSVGRGRAHRRSSSVSSVSGRRPSATRSWSASRSASELDFGQHEVGDVALAGHDLLDPLVDGAGAHQPVRHDGAGLADAPRPVAGLVLDRRVPPAVVEHDVAGGGEVEAGAAGLERQHQRPGARRRPGTRRPCGRGRPGRGRRGSRRSARR